MENYISTNEAAKLWGISPRRIAQLAGQGRIEGAVLIGKLWQIPCDAKRPEDNRSKRDDSSDTRYIFPFPLGSIASIDNLPVYYNDEEKDMVRAQFLYESGNFQESKKISEKLLSTTNNKYIKLGVLYILIYVNISLSAFEDAQKCLLEFRLLAAEPDPHSDEINLLLGEVEITFGDGSSFVYSFQPLPLYKYSAEACVFLITYNMLINFYRDFSGKGIDITQYELLEYQLNKDGYYYPCIFINQYLAQIQRGTNDEASDYCIHRAISMAIKHNILTSFCRLSSLEPESFESGLSKFPAGTRKHLLSIGHKGLTAFNEFLLYLGKTSVFNSLTNEDFRLISFIVKDYTYAKIAEILNLSEITIKRRSQALCKKLGVKNRSELCDIFISAFLKTNVNIK